jgi:ribosome biogenesis GTPase A
MQAINWYPGHMAKAKRQLAEIIKYLDVILEVRDARLPAASHNGDLEILLERRPSIIILNKIDLADPVITGNWNRWFRETGLPVVGVNCKNGQGMKEIWELLEKQFSSRNLKRAWRLGVVGIPNAGKSSILNRLMGTGSAKTGDLPGVTRGKQWVRRKGFEILDTPGMLPPKIVNQVDGMKLALIGTIREEIIPVYDLALFLMENYGAQLFQREKLDNMATSEARLEWFAQQRSFLIKGGELDYNRAAVTLLKDFRVGKLGRISLESPPREIQ